MQMQSVKIGVGVLIWKNGRLALIKRASIHGNGTWAPPGGHIEFGETILETAHRETFEEIGVKIKNLEILGFTEDIEKNSHYITIWVQANWSEGEMKSSDIEFTEGGYFEMNNLPDPLFVPFRNLQDGKIKPLQ